jgi:cation diffusion facilitator family transporter
MPSDTASTQNISRQQRYKATRNVTIISIITNTLLAFAQLVGGFFTHSQALMADGIHTLSDLVSDFIVLIAARFASKDADEDHPYGHGRFETLATVILGVLLAGAAASIVVDAVTRLLQPERLLSPTSLSLFFAVLAVISKEGLYQYTMHVANRIDSDMLRANAWHHRSDAISSLIVLIGIGGALLLNLPWLDAVAAILVGLMILRMGFRIAIRSVSELVDTAVEPEKVSEIRNFISKINGIESLHMLRTRKVGGKIFADVHIQVEPYISVSEGHSIAERTILSLKKHFPSIEDITVHIDPEDDEVSAISSKLPDRNQVMQDISPFFKAHGLEDAFQRASLHYLQGKLDLNLFFASQIEETTLSETMVEIKKLPYIGDVKIYQQINMPH